MSRTVELILGGVGLVMAVGMVAAVPWYIRRLPPDYFVRAQRRRALHSTLLRNVTGVVLIVAGAAMLVLPGQGVLTIILGLSILDHPVKDRALAWLLSRPRVRDGVQRLRADAGKPPLVIPST